MVTERGFLFCWWFEVAGVGVYMLVSGIAFDCSLWELHHADCSAC